MQAIVKIGSSQYKVSPEQVLHVEKLPKKVGGKLTISDVLFYQKDKEVKIGSPYIKGAKVEASIVEEVKGPKIRGFKYKRRKKLLQKVGTSAKLS